MLTLREDINISPIGKDVEVYRNLNAKCFSVKDRATGLVVAHADNFIVSNAVMRVGKGGRERVLKEKRKNVHAVIRGTFIENCIFDTDKLEEIYYNPYLIDCFVKKSTNEKIESCDTVFFSEGKAWLVR